MSFPKIFSKNAILDWSVAKDYAIGEICRGGGVLYCSKLVSGPSTSAGSKDPTQDDGTYWTRVSVDDEGNVHKIGEETISGGKNFGYAITLTENLAEIRKSDNVGYLRLCGGMGAMHTNGAKVVVSGSSFTDPTGIPAGSFWIMTGSSTGYNILEGKPDKSLTWCNKDITGDVHKTGNETIGGIKTFTSDIVMSGGLNLCNQDNTEIIRVCGGSSSSSNSGAKFYAYGASHSSNAGQFGISTGGTTLKQIVGKPDGTLTWNGQTIQTSSDERLKTPISEVSSDILDSWGEVDWGQFQFIEAVNEKGEDARYHIGLIAQSVDRVFKNRGRDILKYGILCHEQSEETEDSPAEDLWMVRYTEALCMEAAYQRRQNKRVESRLQNLEQELALLKEKIKQEEK